MNARIRLATAAAALSILSIGHAAPPQGCTASSPPHLLALVELYTSEGCSSCPPADRWLSRLGRGAPDRAVPLALHVKYWDYIGWKDPYARAEFTDRQRRLAGFSGGRTIYTPGVFVAGRELRAWADDDGQAIAAANAQPARASITIGSRREADGWAVRADAADAPDGASLWVAVTRSALSSRVTAGENRGETLAHDHVVTDWVGPVPIEAHRASWQGQLALPADVRMQDVGIAAFVQEGHGAIAQAFAAPLCGR